MFNSLWSFLLAWYNLPFTALIGLSLLLSLFQLIGLGGADSDGEAEADADVEADAEAEADADTDADADGDADDSPTSLNVLAMVGVGRAPLFVVLILLFGAVGVLGWSLNTLAQAWLGALGPWAFVALWPVAVIGGGVFTARLARLIGRALPPVSTTATRADELVGKRGTVISPWLDERYGQVRLRDAAGTLINVFAVSDEPGSVRRGDTVVLVHYEAGARRFRAVRLEPLERI